MKKITQALSVSVAYLFAEDEENFERVDLNSPAYKAYKILQDLEPEIQHHYHFVFDALDRHARMKELDPSLKKK